MKNIYVDENVRIITNAIEVIELFMAIDPDEARGKYPAVFKKAINQLNDYYEALSVYHELLTSIIERGRWFPKEYLQKAEAAVDDLNDVIHQFEEYLMYAM